MVYRAIIAEDEKELRIDLKTVLLETWPELDICGEATSGEEAIELVESKKPHIAFLDIKMPGLSGMEAARRIAHQCRIVFVTAYDSYAVEAFERGAVDYLLKPVSKERVLQTIQRLKHQLQDSVSNSPQLVEIMEGMLSNLRHQGRLDFLRWIRAQSKDVVRIIPVEEVDYFKAEGNYTLVITKEREALIRKGIKELADELDPDQFWQIHRGVIVNISRIDRVSRSLTGRGVVKLKDRPELLTVTRNYLHLFRQT
jgi:DNA-binding LytR/AlgR family response regulator